MCRGRVREIGACESVLKVFIIKEASKHREIFLQTFHKAPPILLMIDLNPLERLKSRSMCDILLSFLLCLCSKRRNCRKEMILLERLPNHGAQPLLKSK